jgi:two-component system, cell cycle sensor histidine kinase and response regulator CckA
MTPNRDGDRPSGRAGLGAVEELYRVLFEHTGVGLMFVAEDTTILLANKEFENLSGYSKAEVEGLMSWTALIAEPGDLELMKEYHRLRRVDPAAAPAVYDTKFRDKGGGVRDIAMRVTMIPGTTNSLASFLEITEQKRAEDLIRESEEKYRTLVDSLQDTLYRCDRQGNIIFVSPSGARLLGLGSADELIGKNIAADFYHRPEERAIFLEKMKRDGRVTNCEVTLKRGDGSLVVVSTNSQFFYGKDGRVLGVEGVFSDITEKRRLEEERRRLEHQLSQSQKMDAIGQLAGGVAHDFNNILTGIQGNVYLMLHDTPADHPSQRKLQQIKEHVQRGAHLTRQLLGFARGGKYELKTWSINDLVCKTTQLFLETKKEIDAELRLDAGEPRVEVDAGQIEQVLLNLYINAGHAMPQGGHLCVETADIALGAESAAAFDARPGRYVKISVSDTGVGMSQDTLKRIFEPFFTTRAQEGGTGLGLASAYGIIKNHGGVISARSELGEGATITILLPPSGDADEVEAPAPARQPHPGTGAILLVDDEPLILETASQLLARLGYTVTAAANGRAAIDAYRERRPPFDLVILDMVMPGLGGPKVLAEILAVDPGARVVLSSGYGLQGEVREVMEAGCLGFMQKPYSFDELSRIVHEALTRPRRDAL